MQNVFRDYYVFPTDISWYKSTCQLEIKVSGTHDKSAENGEESVSFRRYHGRSA